MTQLTSALEQERRASSQLSQQAEQERLSLHRHLQELQVQLETERAKAQEMSTALGRERELRIGVSTNSGSSNEEQGEDDRREHEQEGSLLERLQRELDDKHAQVGCLQFSIFTELTDGHNILYITCKNTAFGITVHTVKLT